MAKKPKPRAKDQKAAAPARAPRAKAEKPPRSAENFEHVLRRLVTARDADA